MPSATTAATTPTPTLTPSNKHLIRLLAQIHFGRLLDLRVEKGQPVFDDPKRAPRVVHTIKLCGSAPQLPRVAADPLQRREVADLLRLLDEVGDGLIGRIEVAHGLPLFAEVIESA